MLTGEQARALEPMLSPKAIAALHARTAGISCPYEMAIACAENAVANGAELLLGRPVAWIVSEPNSMVVRCGDECISAKRVVNAAGIHADDVARMIDDDSFEIRPRKGEYMLFDRTERRPGKVLFHTPTKLGKGVLVAPTVDGNVFAGPTAVNVNDKEDTSVDANLTEGPGHVGAGGNAHAQPAQHHPRLCRFARPALYGRFHHHFFRKGRAHGPRGGHLLAWADQCACHRRTGGGGIAHHRPGDGRKGTV